MKKILLSLMLICAFAVVKAQVVLNELYAYPNGSNSEFIELYNSGAAENMDCYTIVSYWSDGTNKGWYVLDLPSIVLANQDFLVIGPASTINVQGTSGVPVDVNWNSLPSSGFLKLYTVSGGTYTISDPTPVTDFLVEGDFAPSQNTLTFLYKDGILINGFWGGGASGVLPATITSMPDLAVTGATACSNITASNGDFSTYTGIEFKNQAGGSDNGYARKFDGKCGSWVKTSSQANHTPGLPNGSAAGQTGQLTTSELIICNTEPSKSAVRFTISGFTAPITLADDFPVNVQVYLDYNSNPGVTGAGDGQLNSFDVLVATKPLAGLGNDSIWFSPAKQPVIVAYRTKRGCFDKVVAVPNGCINLPVKYNLFTAARNHSTVVLKWETAFEQNNSGFAIERNIRGTWEQVSFVPTQATGGNSESALAYLFVDLNDVKGITQYRIRQVDLDARSTLSEIRAVRGEGQAGHTIVYPNPSFDGRVSIVFEDATVTRDASLSDMSGRILKLWKGVTNNNIQIDNLTPGMYSLRIVVAETGEQSVQKIIVSKR